MLARRPEEITLGQVVRLFEGQSELVECISHPERCTISDDCRVRLAWQEATRALYEKLAPQQSPTWGLVIQVKCLKFKVPKVPKV